MTHLSSPLTDTPLVDLIARCELYAKVIEGITVVDDDWQPGDPERREPRETLLSVAKILHRIRAQRQPEPVAWRWRPRGATLWIYNPEAQWLAEHRDDVEAEPLYAAPTQTPPTDLARITELRVFEHGGFRATVDGIGGWGSTQSAALENATENAKKLNTPPLSSTERGSRTTSCRFPDCDCLDGDERCDVARALTRPESGGQNG